MPIDWQRVADERLQISVEIRRDFMSTKRKREIYDRLVTLHLTPEDIREFWPGFFDEPEGEGP